MASEYPVWQETTRNKINMGMLEAIEKFGRTIEDLNPSVLLSLSAVLVTSLYAYMYFNLPWILWKHMVIDVLMILLLPFLLVVFSDEIKDISDFSTYENAKLKCDLQNLTTDVQLHVWQAPKYYDHVKTTGFRYISIGYNVNEAIMEEDSQVQEQAESSRKQIEDPVPEELSTLSLRSGASYQRRQS